MKTLPLKTLIIIISAGLFAVSCGDTTTGIEGSAEVTFQGEVENLSSSGDSQGSVEGATVTVARVTADGSLETIGNAQATTNAEGEYSLQVDLSVVSETANHIVIVASKGGQTAKAYVAAEIEDGATIAIQPITFESSAESSIYENVIASGNADIVTKANIEATVNTEVATAIESSAQSAADVAAGLAAAAQARAEFYAEQGVEVTEEQFNQIVQLKQEALVQLAAQLQAAETAEAEEAAFRTFLQTVANAQLEAGLEAWAAAEANDLAARVLVNESSELSAEAQAELRRTAYYFTAVTLEEAVKAKAEALGASEATINAIAEAGAELQANILAAATPSEAQIDAFFAEFNEAVENAIATDASLNGEAYILVNNAISGVSGVKATFETTLNAATSLNVILNAYNAFYSGVNALVESTFTGLSSAEVQAYTRLLVLANLST